MKAIVYTHYGPPDVLQLTEVEKPTRGSRSNWTKTNVTPSGRMADGEDGAAADQVQAPPRNGISRSD